MLGGKWKLWGETRILTTSLKIQARVPKENQEGQGVQSPKVLKKFSPGQPILQWKRNLEIAGGGSSEGSVPREKRSGAGGVNPERSKL